MQISEEQVKSILQIHNSLWNAVNDFDSDYHCLTYQDQTYDIYIPAERGYASVILPNPQGTKFLWITQNLNKSTYGSLQILKARQKDQDLRITWVVDTRNGQFNYRSNVSTHYDSDGTLLNGHIEYYDSLGTDIIWSTNKSILTRKAKF